MADKPHLNLAVIGHIDNGKSTIAGHLLLQTGTVTARQVEQLQQQAAEAGKASFKYAWLLDRRGQERARGITVDMKVAAFSTPKYDVTLVDTPGHEDYIKNMVGGTSQCEAAMAVVSADAAELEAALSEHGQTREHLLLAYTVGIKQLVVVVNKMDLVEYAEAAFLAAQEKIQAVLKKVGFNPKAVPVVPVSGFQGENLTKPSSKMPWFRGWTAEAAGAEAAAGVTLVQAIDQVRLPPAPVDRPLRFAVTDVHAVPGVGAVVAGRVDSGVITPGTKLVFAPGGATAEVLSIERHHKPLPRAVPGASVGLCVAGLANPADLRRGTVAGDAAAAATAVPRAAVSFVGQVMLLQGDALRPGFTPTVDCGLFHGPVKFRQLLAKIDRKSGATLEENPATIKAGDTALVEMVPQIPLVTEPYSECPMLGRFALRDQKRVIGVGLVKSVVYLDIPGSKKKE